MHKTLHKVFTKSSLKSQATEADMNAMRGIQHEQPDMQAVLQQASRDLLQPRAEAVAALLQKLKAN